MRSIGLALGFAACVLAMGMGMGAAGSVAWGQSAPYPAYSGDPIVTVGVPDDYQGTRNEIRRLEASGSKQSYYVVAIASAGKQRGDEVRYADQLFERWKGDSRFRADRAVLIVLTVRDRKIAVHPGPALARDYGLRGQTIARELLNPHFLPEARAGRYDQGLTKLIQAFEAKIVAQDRQSEQNRLTDAERVKQLGRDAESALATANALLGESQTELKAKRESGLNVDEQAAAIQRSATRLQALPTIVKNDPKAGLAQAQEVQTALINAIDQLRTMAIARSEVQKSLEGLDPRLVKLEEGIDQARKQGLGLEPVQERAERARGLIDEARRTVQATPLAAQPKVQQADQLLTEAQSILPRLPELHRQAQERLEQVRALEKTAAEEWTKARTEGIEFEELKPLPDDALQGENDEKILQTLAARESEVQSYRDRLRSHAEEVRQRRLTEEGRRRWLTQILPATMGALAGMIGGLIFTGYWWVHRRAKNGYEAAMKSFKDRVLPLVDKLDALKERHKLLPYNDPDYKEPMTGETLALYNHVQDRLGKLWDRWLELMDGLDKAKQAAASGGFLERKAFHDAVNHLEANKAFEDLEARLPACEADLQKLNDAHERAASEAKVVDDQFGRIDEHRQALQAANLPFLPYQTFFEAGEQLLAQGRSRLTPDPLGSQALFRQALEKFTTLSDRVQRALDLAKQAASATKRIEEATAKTKESRSQGLALREPGSDPDVILKDATQRRDLAREQLARGDSESSSKVLTESLQFVEQAERAIERTIAAKTACAEELKAGKAAGQKLSTLLGSTRSVQHELDRDFDPASWSDIASHLTSAEDRVNAADRLFQQAAEASSDRVQHYLQASESISQAKLKRKEAETLLRGLSQRWQDLSKMRRESESLRGQVKSAIGQARQYAQTNRDAVRDEAFHLIDKAQDDLNRVEPMLRVPQPHWAAIYAELSRIGQQTEAARGLAEQDVKAREQFLAALGQIQARAEHVERFLRSETKDRPRANQRFQAARQQLDAFANGQGAAPGDWPLLAERLREMDQEIAQAEQLAREDVRLADQAEAEILEAEREIRKTRGFYRNGASVDPGPAQYQLDMARTLQSRGDYERAAETAAVARTAARNAIQEAQREADRRARRQDEQRWSQPSGASFPNILNIPIPNFPSFPSSLGIPTSFPASPSSSAPSPSQAPPDTSGSDSVSISWDAPAPSIDFGGGGGGSSSGSDSASASW